jgi:hypothetical protein
MLEFAVTTPFPGLPITVAVSDSPVRSVFAYPLELARLTSNAPKTAPAVVVGEAASSTKVIDEAFRLYPDEAPEVTAAAVAGVTDVNTPKPKAATATSATRLKVVFVDICFLSISRVREFPALGFG